MKKIILLGATGSIGMQSIDVVLQHQDIFEIVGLSCGKNTKQLRTILKQISVKHVCVQLESDYKTLQKEYSHIHFYHGANGILELLNLHADIVINAIVGFAGLAPSLKSIETKKVLALANKESLVVGGELVKQALTTYGGIIYPIDSEHSAIFQALQGNRKQDILKLVVSASGGSFRDYTREQLHDVTPELALKHPNWSMGSRITIDSATMMNKGFEVIEAHYLFDVDFDQISVLMNTESIIHSMIHYVDHSFMAQLGTADMRIPIQYALSYPNRLALQSEDILDLTKIKTLHFREVCTKRFPLLGLAYEVGKKKGNAGAVLNAADEVCVELFLQGKISFLEIESYIAQCVANIPYIASPNYEQLAQSDAQARAFVYALIEGEN